MNKEKLAKTIPLCNMCYLLRTYCGVPVVSYNQGRNILRISLISPFFEIWSSDEKVDFGLSVECNRIFRIRRGWWTSRLYSEPYWTIFCLLDPRIRANSFVVLKFRGDFPFYLNIMTLIASFLKISPVWDYHLEDPRANNHAVNKISILIFEKNSKFFLDETFTQNFILQP